MAANATKIQQMAKMYADLANALAAIEKTRLMAIDYGFTYGITWTDQALAAIDAELVDADGNIRGYNFSPADVSNFVGAIAAIKSGDAENQQWMDTYLQTVLKLADPA